MKEYAYRFSQVDLHYLDNHLDDEVEEGIVHLPQGGEHLCDVGDGQGTGHGCWQLHDLPGPLISPGLAD